MKLRLADGSIDQWNAPCS